MKIDFADVVYAGVLVALMTTACGDSGTAREPFGQSQDPGSAESEEMEGSAELNVTGVDESRYLDELEPSEWELICQWMVEVQGGPHTVECGDGVSVRVDTVEVCVEQDEFPHCEVGLLVACVQGQAEDLCADAPPACDDFYACVYGTR